MCSVDSKRICFFAIGLLGDPCCLLCTCSVTGQMTWKRTSERLLRRSLFRGKCVWLVPGDRLLGVHSEPRERVFSTTSTNWQEGALTWIRVQKGGKCYYKLATNPQEIVGIHVELSHSITGFQAVMSPFICRFVTRQIVLHYRCPQEPHKRNSLNFAYF